MPRKIALVGTASSGCLAPFQDSSYSVWGVSARADYVTRADRWFEIHNLETEPRDWADTWRKTLKGFTHDIAELMMFYPEPDLAPKVTRYPIERISERFGTFFMTSSFSWMMALAIDEMVPVGTVAPPGEFAISISGVDMEAGSEYESQRAGFRHFISLAQALGIEVSRLANGGLVYEPIPYPLWQEDPLLCKLDLRQKFTKENLTNFNVSLQMVQTMMASTKAILQEFEASKKDGYDRAKRAAELAKQLRDLEATSMKLSKDIVHWEGVDDEQTWLRAYLQP